MDLALNNKTPLFFLDIQYCSLPFPQRLTHGKSWEPDTSWRGRGGWGQDPILAVWKKTHQLECIARTPPALLLHLIVTIAVTLAKNNQDIKVSASIFSQYRAGGGGGALPQASSQCGASSR